MKLWANFHSYGRKYSSQEVSPRRDLKRKINLVVVRVFDTDDIGGFTTNAFWGNELLWGIWQYRKGKSIEASSFDDPKLPNVTPFSSPGVIMHDWAGYDFLLLSCDCAEDA